jgi:hypothetical protein
MKKLLLLALSLISLSAIARPPILWEGDNAWLLRDNLKFHSGDTKIMKGNLDPSAVAVSASAGSMYIASSGKWYKKSDSGLTTNWTEIGGAVAETDPVFSVSPAQTITLPQIASWDIAYGWGNHASAENYGQMSEYDNSSPTAIDIVDAWHPIRLLSACSALNGVTFDADSVGVVASVATYAAGAKIQVTDTAHGLLDGEITCFVNSTDYDGCYVVEEKTDNTFVVSKAYNADRTFNWYQPSTLKIAKSGIYRINYNTSSDSATSSKVFTFLPFKNTTALTCAACSKLFGTGTDYGQCVSSTIVGLEANDYVWLATMNETDNTDITIHHGTVNIEWIGNAP